MGATADLSFVKNYSSVRSRLWNTQPRPVKPLRDIIDLGCIRDADWPPEPPPPPPPARKPHELDETIYPFPIGAPNLTTNTQKARFIIRNFAAIGEITVEELSAERRSRAFLVQRRQAISVISKSTTFSLGQIGKFFNNRDHTTILHSIRVQARIDAGEAIAPGAAVGVAR